MRFAALLIVFAAVMFGIIHAMPESFWQSIGGGWSGAFGIVLGVAAIILAALFDEVLP